METFEGKLAVVTGGGSGMGRELVLQLAAEACSVATCDLDGHRVQETAEKARAGALGGTRITGHVCDVADESQVLRFRDEVLEQHGGDHVDLLFNNAGIGGGGSFVTDTRQSWERTFGVNWFGVYYCCRAFLPLLINSEEAMLVNTSSVNGFWASLGPGRPHTAYSTAKFAVKGFSEALVEDLRVNAPHVQVAVVMPGHVGTEIVRNSLRAHGQPPLESLGQGDLDEVRGFLAQLGLPADGLSRDQLVELISRVGDDFRDKAPLSAAQAAAVILDGVRSGRWRILVGQDAHAVDAFVRANPDDAYDHAFLDTALRSARPPTTGVE